MIFRITRPEYASDVDLLLNGEGGMRASGRWHRQGSRVAYFSSHSSLAVLERLAHLEIHPRDQGGELSLATLDIPANFSRSLERSVSSKELGVVDPDWRLPNSQICRQIGELWFAERVHLLLRVPSALVPDGENVIVNCEHHALVELKRMADFKVEPFELDDRISAIIDPVELERRRNVSKP